MGGTPRCLCFAAGLGKRSFDALDDGTLEQPNAKCAAAAAVSAEASAAVPTLSAEGATSNDWWSPKELGPEMYPDSPGWSVESHLQLAQEAVPTADKNSILDMVSMQDIEFLMR